MVGWTDSPSFPVTPGALDTQFPSNGAGSFAARFHFDGSLAYATFLDAAWLYAVVVDAGGNAVIGGSGAIPGEAPPAGKEPGFLLTLNSTGSSIANFAYIGGDTTQGSYQTTSGSMRFPGPFALAGDAAGNIYVEGVTAAPDFPVIRGSYVSPLRSDACNEGPSFARSVPPADIYVMKLAGIGQPPIYSALLGAQCASIPGAIAVNQQGNATFTLATGAGFPLSRPFATTGNCGGNSAVVAQLSADGSTLDSSYLETCGALPLAAPPGSTVFVGANLAGSAVVVKLPVREGSTQIR